MPSCLQCFVSKGWGGGGGGRESRMVESTTNSRVGSDMLESPGLIGLSQLNSKVK